MKMLTRRNEKSPALRRDFEDLLDRFLGNWEESWLSAAPGDRDYAVLPPVDVADTEDAYQLTMDLPGMAPEDIEIQAVGQNLLISGERKSEKHEKDKDYLRRELRYGSFRRTIPLPEGARISRDDVKAQYRDGILRVRVPKMHPTPVLRIPVEAKD